MADLLHLRLSVSNMSPFIIVEGVLVVWAEVATGRLRVDDEDMLKHKILPKHELDQDMCQEEGFPSAPHIHHTKSRPIRILT